MRKMVFGKKLSRERATREALFVSLVESLVMNRKIKTTKTKAFAVSGLIDKLVVLAKKETLSSKRELMKFFRGNRKVVFVLCNEIAKQFANRNSGFTRMIPLVNRKGDMAQMVRLEWTYENLSTETK